MERYFDLQFLGVVSFLPGLNWTSSLAWYNFVVQFRFFLGTLAARGRFLQDFDRTVAGDSSGEETVMQASDDESKGLVKGTKKILKTRHHRRRERKETTGKC